MNTVVEKGAEMGCDIHAFAEVKRDGKWESSGAVFPLDDLGQRWEKRSHTESPFDWRSYGMFGFLADVRNYSRVPCIQKPIDELPKDASSFVVEAYGDGGYHSLNVLTAKQLLAYDYDALFEDRRCVRDRNGAALAAEGEGEMVTMRDFLGGHFFRDLEILKSLGEPDEVRVIFWFDN